MRLPKFPCLFVRRQWVAASAVLFLVSGSVQAAGSNEKPAVHESYKSIWIRVSAPIPDEVENDSQAKALAREAAIALGQGHLLSYVLQKRTRSKKTLAEAEIPSLELQNRIRGIIKGAVVSQTKWDDKNCSVTLTMSKKQFKEILRKY